MFVCLFVLNLYCMNILFSVFQRKEPIYYFFRTTEVTNMDEYGLYESVFQGKEALNIFFYVC